ncbi:mitochondrial arginine transporter BAC1 isoform X1 [Micractinium conductrix]|uniref:Mitochondrial arginine transporter BAC1 isoform X1 n=1 Tax=Micractinium conductrix TaxID=554055 RepID=A0A2P6VPR2_9CHLO|nr:mitochondrial arginine transporter BAC1 isoform X1 [Micractinium conductrix]|eukprot:PSC76045.1 mitochondrial arginine transporter BAC1 isoform X1 [Micractinium conductrix]
MGAGAGGTSVAADYVAGAVAGSANIIVGFPADTVKVRLQNRLNPYSGAWHCATSIVRYEGFRALYRGMSPQLVGGAVETGVNYAAYQAMLTWTQSPAAAGGLGLPAVAAVPLSAASAGAVLSFVLSPAELVKCRLQTGTTDRYHMYAGPLDCLRQTVRAEGLRGLMRGLGGTMAREMPGNAVYFGTYRLLRHWLPGKPPEAERSQPASFSLWQHLADASSATVCGGLAGMVMWAVVLPLDAAKTRIQTAYPGSPHDVGVLRQLRVMAREGGLGTLYAGLSPTLVRAFPANAAQWLAFESCMKLAQHLQEGGGT